jgi:hypothetical protein
MHLCMNHTSRKAALRVQNLYRALIAISAANLEQKIDAQTINGLHHGSSRLTISHPDPKTPMYLRPTTPPPNYSKFGVETRHRRIDIMFCLPTHHDGTK